MNRRTVLYQWRLKFRSVDVELLAKVQLVGALLFTKGKRGTKTRRKQNGSPHIFNYYTTFSVYYTYIDTVYVRILRDRGKGESVCTSGDGGDAHDDESALAAFY